MHDQIRQYLEWGWYIYPLDSNSRGDPTKAECKPVDRCWGVGVDLRKSGLLVLDAKVAKNWEGLVDETGIDEKNTFAVKTPIDTIQFYFHRVPSVVDTLVEGVGVIKDLARLPPTPGFKGLKGEVGSLPEIVKWRLLGEGEKKFTRMEKLVIETLIDSDPMTYKQVAEKMGRDKGNTWNMLESLVSRGVVKKPKLGGNVYYTLKEGRIRVTVVDKDDQNSRVLGGR